MNKSRDISLDYIRTIGIFLIILAHIPDVPNIIMAIRRFDVPLMVIISGYLFSKVQVMENENAFIYIIKRFKRLVLPVWIFLCIFFIGTIVMTKIIKYEYPFSKEDIFRSFLLLDGIGYVWIIRIYLFVALMGPLLYKKLSKKNIRKNLLIYYGMYEIILTLYYIFNCKSYLLESIIFYPIPYVILFVYGTKFEKIKNNLLGLSGLLIIGVGLYLSDRNIFNYLYLKYPPRFFYIFYSILISNILLGNKDIFLKINNNTIKKIVSFIGNSTMWIYLWHIILIMILQILNRKNIKLNYIISYILVIVFSILITFIQNKAIKIISVKYENNKLSKNLKMIFLG